MKYFSKRRTDKKQKRKHVSQMTIHEKKRCERMLYDSLRVYGKFSISKHALEKRYEKIPLSLLKSLILNKNISRHVIEYNIKYLSYEDRVDERVVVRIPCNNKVDICMSISIISGRIITVYYNKKNDNHDTIDLSYYDSKLLIK